LVLSLGCRWDNWIAPSQMLQWDPPHEKDNTNTLVERTKNSRSKRNQNSGMSGI
jgi:hypothetical protein